jgi:hypothetical protein
MTSVIITSVQLPSGMTCGVNDSQSFETPTDAPTKWPCVQWFSAINGFLKDDSQWASYGRSVRPRHTLEIYF